MDATLDAQTAGPLIVLGGFTASELSIRLLDAYPACAFAWYLNLEVFRPFEIARAETSPLQLLLGPEAIAIDLFLIAVVLMVRRARFKFGIAFLANLSFGIALALTYAWLWGAAYPQTASLVGTGPMHGADAVLIAMLLASSFTAFLMSHVAFVRDILTARQPRLGLAR